MNRKVIKKYRWIEIAILAWTLVAVLAMTVLAAETSTYSCFQLNAESSGEVEITTTSNGWSIKAYGTDGSCGATDTQTVKFTISNTDTTRGVSFDISVTSSDASPSGAPSGSQTLAASGSLTQFTATSGAGSSTFTTINISISNIVQESLGASIKTTIRPGIGGTIAVDGTEVTAQTDFTKLDTETYTLTATADSGYTFYGWMSSGGILTADGNVSYTYAGKTESVLWPLFVREDSALYYIKDANPIVYYGYFDDAISAAGDTGTIILLKSGTMYGADSSQFTLTGQTFLVPYSESNYNISTSTYTDSSGDLKSTWIYANNAWTSANYATVSGVLEPNTSVFRSLTIPSGTTLNVASGGKFVIGGTIVSGTSGTTGVAGATAGPHGNVTVNGTINVNSGGILSTCGYILGGGSVNVAGGSVYQPFTLADYHDGHHTVNCTKNATFPANRYTMQNIQAPLTLSSGGRMYGYIDIYTQTTASIIKQRHNVACEIIVGQAGDSALIKMASGATMTTTYDPNDYVTITSGALGNEFYSKLGKRSVILSGGATLGNIDLTVNVAGTDYTVQSSDCDFPVSYQYDFTLQNGTYTLPYNLALLPGASMKVASSADLVVSSGSFVVFDGLRDHIIRDTADVNINSWYEYHYPSTANLQSKGYNGLANLIVEGSLTVNSGASFGGYVQTSGTGTVNMNGTASATAGVGNVVKYGGIVNAYAGRTERTLNAWLFAQNGNLIAAETGKSYTAVNSGAHTVDGYAYRVYTKAGDTSTYTDLTATLGTNVTGSWQCAEGYHTDEDPTDHTCDVCGFVTECVDAIPEGETYADHNCDICGKVLSECSDSEDDEDILCDTCGKILCAHAEVTAIAEDPATCIADGHKAYWQCTTCELYYADEACTTEIPDLEVWLADETETGGRLTALGHTYGDATYEWTDYTACVATRVCTVCTEEIEGHTESAEGVITSEDTTPANCKETGVRTYTATFDVDWAAQQTATEEIAIDETAHAWDNACDTECNNGCGTIREITHSYESVVTDPTCTVGGFTTHTCTVCGHSYQDSETSAKGCSYSDEWESDADSHWHVCSVCGEESEKTAHADGNNDHKCDTCEYVMSECAFTVKGDLKTAGTCMAEAVYKAKCSVCGAVSETETIKGEKDSANHMGKNTVTGAKDATCTEAGYTGDTVCECGVTVKTGEEIPAKNHNYGETSYTWADDGKSCTAKRICANDASHVEEAAATITSEVTTSASCTVMGTTTYTATFGVDWAEEQTKSVQDVPVIDHTYDQQNTDDTFKKSDATCTAAAVYYYSCSCGAKGTETFEYGDKLAHSYGEPQFTWNSYECSAVVKCSCGDEQNVDVTETSEVTATATCTVEGVKTYTATAVYNGTTYTSDQQPTENLGIDSNNHVNTKEEAEQSATCTEPGYTAGTYCEDCKTWISGHEVINALEHSWTVSYEWSEDGKSCTATRACGNDPAHNETETVTASGAVKTAATCQAMGWTTYTANFEAEWAETQTKDVQDIAKLDHSYTGDIKSDGNGKDATHSYKCVNGCEEYGAAVKHAWNGGEQTKDPACEAAGEMTYTCTVEGCGATYTEEIKATGHVNTTSKTEQNTDGKTHTTTVTCACNHVVSTTTENCIDINSDFECDTCGGLLVNAYTDAVTLAEEHTGTRTVEGATVTLKVTGNVAFAQAQGVGDWNHWVGFKITSPVDMSKVTILRPDNQTRVMADIKDGNDYAYLYWGMTNDSDKQAEYKIDWNGDGIYDLTVILDASEAKLLECVHSWQDGEVTTPASCTTEGVMTYTCANCGTTKTEVIQATGHKNTVTVNAKEATCGADGYTGDTYCNDCQTTIATGEVIQATGNHVYTWTTTTPATCVSTGVETGTCSCGAETTREIEIDSNAHSLVNVEAKAATCTQVGWDGYEYCDREGCEHTTYVEIPATESHSDSDTDNDHICDTCEKVMSECSGGTATCEKKAVCTTCGAEYGELAEHTPGEAVEENRVESTCTVAGSYDSVVKCSVCGEELSRENVALALAAHVYDKEVAAEAYLNTAATCKDKATYFKSCTCGAKGTETFEYGELSTEHSYVDGTCTICGAADPDAVKFEPTFSNGSDTTTVETGTADSGAATYRFQAGTNKDSAPYVIITAPVDGWELGEENEFIVESENDIACVVIVKDAEGKYTRLTATTDTETKEHSFAATLDEGYEIIVAVKGDANGDGSYNVGDATMIARAVAGSLTISDDVRKIAANLNNDADCVIDVGDATMAKRAVAGSLNIEW